jgi:ribosomal protein S27AE
MASLRIECLRCGEPRLLQPAARHRVDGGECPRCGYVGWAASTELDERLRGALRARPVEWRRVYAS